MSFIQIMQLQTSRIDEVRAAVDKWQKAAEAKTTVTGSIVAQDRDKPDRYWVIVSFDTYEDAMKNSSFPETDALSQQTIKLADGPPVFFNLDVIEERLIGDRRPGTHA